MIYREGRWWSTKGIEVEASPDRYYLRVKFREGLILEAIGEAGNQLRSELRSAGVSAPQDW